ncbi:MAG: chorismate mutase, partial [Planctomycetes bacterium]|nr:chorismate mutase [Planctomycetota bacterium]
MAKKKTTRPAKKKSPVKKLTKKAAARSPSVAVLRAQIDKIDRELVGLANQRAKLALEVGKLKGSAGEDAYDPGRESEVLTQAVGNSKGPLPDRCVRAVFRELISGSRSL